MKRTNTQARRIFIMSAVAVFLVASTWFRPALAQTARHPSGRALPSNANYSTPEEQGMNSETLAAGVEYLIDHRETYRIHSAIVIRHDHVVLDARFYPFSRRWRHEIASVTKSVTSTLVGIAIDQGFLDGVNMRVLDFFPDYTVANRNALKERMTLEHLLTMRSGFECDPSDSEATLTAMTGSPDWVQFTLDLPMAAEPGENRVYCSPNVHLLSAILQRATGMSTLEFARQNLFRPLGILDVRWLTDPQGINHGWGDLYLKPEDIVKLGQLYLNQGRWSGSQVVSSWWTEEATTGAGQQVPNWPPGQGYSYLWYYAPGYYFASGRGGQWIYVFTEENVVVAFNAGAGIGDYLPIPREFLESWVLAAVESTNPLPPNPDGVSLLASRVSEAAVSIEGTPEEVPPLPSIAETISGQIYLLDANIYGLSQLRLTFPGGDEATFEVEMPEVLGGPDFKIEIGLDNVNRFSPGRHDVIAAAKGGWVSDTRFSVILDELALINLWQWDLLFDGDTVTFSLENLAGGELPATITGRLARSKPHRAVHQ